MAGAKVLILVPAPTARGGITNYYQVLRNEFGSELEYFERGARTWPIKDSKAKEFLRIFRDYAKFLIRMAKGDVSLVQSTTSLSLATTFRDGLFLMIGKAFGAKTIVFFRGWDHRAERIIHSKQKLFRLFFMHTDAAIVLTERARETLCGWGYKKQIYLETTLVDKKLIEDIDIQMIKSKYQKLESEKRVNILFLSRIEKAKGIFELFNAFVMLNSVQDSIFEYSLNICGDGLAYEELNSVFQTQQLKNIRLSGHTTGDAKRKAFLEAHLFVFPSYGEGMPNSVLEAMGFGLPVICTPVGGLVDFFIDDVHGKIVPIGEELAIHKAIQGLCSNTEKLLGMAISNHLYAVERFRSDKVGERIKNIFQEVARK